MHQQVEPVSSLHIAALVGAHEGFAARKVREKAGFEVNLDEMTLVGAPTFLLDLADFAFCWLRGDGWLAGNGNAIASKASVKGATEGDGIVNCKYWGAQNILVHPMNKPVSDSIMPGCVHTVGILKLAQWAFINPPWSIIVDLLSSYQPHPLSPSWRSPVYKFSIHFLFKMSLHQMS